MKSSFLLATNNFQDKNTKQIHRLGGYEVLVHLIVLSFGMFFDVVFPFPKMPDTYATFLGFGALLIGSGILWYTKQALRSFQAELHGNGSIDASFFQKGPYAFFPHPTHAGLTFLIIGFALFSHGYYIIFSTILAAIIIEFFIIPKMEREIICVHGVCYEEYRFKKVPHIRKK